MRYYQTPYPYSMNNIERFCRLINITKVIRGINQNLPVNKKTDLQLSSYRRLVFIAILVERAAFAASL